MPVSKSQKIIEILTVFADLTGKELSSVTQTMFIKLLSPYETGRIEAAAQHLLRTRKWNTIPLPADFIEFLDPPDQVQVLATTAWRTVLDTIDIHGYVATVQFEDAAITQTILAMASSWSAFCNRTGCSDDEFKWLQKEFEQRYVSFRKMPQNVIDNPVLIGWIDAQNGTEHPEPVLIASLLSHAKRIGQQKTLQPKG